MDVALLYALTEAEYREIRSKIIDANVNSDPSLYLMTKSKPNIITKQYGAKEETDITTTTTLDLLPKLDSVIYNVRYQDKN